PTPVGSAGWRVHFRLPADALATGRTPLLLVDDLPTLGPGEVAAETDTVPPLEELDTSTCHAAFGQGRPRHRAGAYDGEPAGDGAGRRRNRKWRPDGDGNQTIGARCPGQRAGADAGQAAGRRHRLGRCGRQRFYRQPAAVLQRRGIVARGDRTSLGGG